MKHLIRLSDLDMTEVGEIFEICDDIQKGKYENFLKGKTIVMFFPSSSIRTRITFEKGIYLLGGQSVLFSPDTLDKKEDLRDVAGYLNNWADVLIVRHKDMAVIEKIADNSSVPVINALTDINHPCEMLSDMYALNKMRKGVKNYKFLFCGTNGNIGRAWKEASELFGFELEQCCSEGYELEGVKAHHDIREAIIGKDIICTDALPSDAVEDFKNCRVTREIMDMANCGALLDPCPPFYRGEEVSDDVIDSDYFVGYGFKKYLLPVQQAIMIYCMTK
ncbi:MAG: peptide transporter [Oscillospiraceae bacterium]|nr:peptide transporter [Oscillospiraceae bacterium]